MSFAREPQDQEQLIEYVRQALAKLDAGEAVDPTALCRAHPHLARPLAEVLGLAGELPLLQQAALREDPLAGVLLAGRYRLGHCLGRGAMGVVYAGDDQELRRPVAVKILDVRLFRDPDAERRFQREAEALAALQHGNVVAVFDRGRTPEGIHFLVMERLDGATLAALLERAVDDDAAAAPAGAAVSARTAGAAARTAGSAPAAVVASAAWRGLMAVVTAHLGGPPPEAHWPRQCARWARDLANGLAAAHERQLVHRDVKPSNVFVTSGGRPVLLDFGIAARASDQRLTATQTTLGTPWYMPPEQVRASGTGAADPTLDVYGLGATLYHMLAQRPPYVGDAADVLARLPVEDPAPLLRVRPDVPRDLAAIVERCLEREPARRYADAAALAADLDAFLQHQPVRARPIGALARRWRAWRRAPARPVAIAAVVVAVLAGGVAWGVAAERAAEARVAELSELEARLPSLLAIEGWPDERALSVLGDEHRAAIAELDRYVELAPDDLAARLMRGCLFLDLGDAERAAVDLDHLAGRGDSDYLRELAARYRIVAPDANGVRTVDLAGLPAPRTAAECFVAGFHELRHSHVAGFAERADELLARAAPTYVPARAQRLFSLAARAERAPKPQQLELCQLLYQETVSLEVEFGRPTARTEAMRGVALLLQRRFADSVPCLQRALELRPGRHGPHHNLGVAFRRLYRLDDADRELQRALALRPFAWNTRYTLAQVATDRGDFARARELADGLAKTGLRNEAVRQPELVGAIAVAEALARRAGEPAVARAAAARAVAAYDEALAVRATPDGRLRREFAAALLADDAAAAVMPFATALARDPDNAYQLANLAALLPTSGLDEAQVRALRTLLQALATKLAEGDAALAARLRAEPPREPRTGR